MLKALIKKQFLSVFGMMGMNRKNGKGKRRGVGSYIAIIAVLCLALGLTFFGYSLMVCGPLVNAGLGWLYFVYAEILGITFAVVGSVFMTQSCLYEAKDNDFLLSLPIPPKYILFVRMVPLYVQNFLFCAVAFVPACIAWCITTAVTAAQVFIWLVTLVLLPLFTLFITCLIGLLLALITMRMRDKTLVTVLLSVVFLVVYFIVYALFMNNMAVLTDNAEGIASGIKGAVYPLYKFGTACTGDFVGLAVLFVITAATFGGLYVALSFTYIKLVTARHGGIKAKYKGKPEKRCPVTSALLKKETRRFFSSGMYFLNCGLGVILLIIATVFFTVKGKELMAQIEAVEMLKGLMPVLITGAVCLISSMDEVSAPSISLEGKTLWILQSTPTDAWCVLKAKLILHYLVTAPAATVCTAVFAIFLSPDWGMVILMLLAPSVAVSLSGVLGLVFNLKKPNLEWDNETVVLKQSSSVMLTLLSGFGIFLVSAALFFALNTVLIAELALLISLVLPCAAIAGLTAWLKKRGTEIFASL